MKWNSEKFDDYLMKSGVFTIAIDTLLHLQRNQNMLFCTGWSIFREISKRENPSLVLKIWDKYCIKFNTIVLWKIFCPLMQISRKCLAVNPSHPHICTKRATNTKTEECWNLNFNPFEFTENSFKRETRRNEIGMRKRINSFSKFERKKNTSSERRRSRIRSMALVEEPESLVEWK